MEDDIRTARQQWLEKQAHKNNVKELRHVSANQRAATLMWRQRKENERRQEEALHLSMADLEKERRGFISDLEQYLGERDDYTTRKKKAHEREWQSKVYGDIQTQVDGQLDALEPAELNRRRRAQMDEYLHHEKAKQSQVRAACHRSCLVRLGALAHTERVPPADRARLPLPRHHHRGRVRRPATRTRAHRMPRSGWTAAALPWVPVRPEGTTRSRRTRTH